ncbi:structural maintenance of chromosomes protein 1B isoform X1 [Brienomyrus brachyistius]|uniref:structural maintenance of chromosomes protein 1B isoform X1 n=1 Tax=Brienomyrus brachyistius TaxID=42636 RepID=UPI0020B39C07|nr:structural maintenance of chromosomes protein 1B isoform X1 [Brienomyrus brachyistius]
MGYMKQIEVENFKSWRGKQVLGPFKRFTCIVGTNGSGKSNVMDALGFVMGERAAALRVRQARELICGAHVGRPVAGTASVSMVYCEDNGEEIVFKRTVAGDASEYRINGRLVTFTEYASALEKIGVLIKARNCLVFQGTVESIAMKNAKEMTRVFERISGSLELADEYIRAKEALLRAKEDTQFHFKKKKTAAAEKKHASQVKEEVQRYQAIVDDLNQNKVQLILCQLFHNEKDLDALQASRQHWQALVLEKKSGLVLWEQSMQVLKKELGHVTRGLQKIEKEVRMEEQTQAHRRSQYLKAKEQTAHQVRKLGSAHSSLQGALQQQRRKEQELEELRAELVQLDRSWRQFEEEAQTEGAPRGVTVELAEAQLEHYKELKDLSRKQGSTLRQQVEKLRWEVKADWGKLEFDQRRKKEVQASIKHTQAQLEECSRRAEKLGEYSSTCSATLAEQQQLEESLRVALDEGHARSREVERELAETIDELQNACVDGHESRRQQRRGEMLDSLRKLYPEALIGRLLDLCHPIHKKYQLAVTKMFGRYMNAIVVTSEKVARDCIRFLKQERADPETFLPLDYLEVSALNERLREVRGAKMGVDVVQYAAPLGRAVQFVCGNTLVCDTVKEAQHVAFRGPQRLKTVALDGTMFFKSGAISGGASDLRSKARRWDEKDMGKLKERREQLTAELRGLLKLKHKEAELKQVQTQVKGIQTRLKFSLSELDAIRKKNIPACLAEKSRLESLLLNLESEIQMQKDNMELKEKKIGDLQTKLNEVDDQVFSDFCAEIGVANIREYEQEYLKQQQEMDSKRLQFETQRTRLTTQLEFEQSQLEQSRGKIREWEDTLRKGEQGVSQLRKEEEQLMKGLDEIIVKVQELRNSLLGQKSLVSDCNARLDEKVTGRQQCSRELLKLQRELMSVKVALEKKQQERHNLLLSCKVRDLPVTLLSGSMDDITEEQLDSETTIVTVDIYEREKQMVIDYSALRRELQELEGEEEVESELEKLQETLGSLETALQRSGTPDLKALQKMNEVKEMFHGIVEAFEASTKMTRRCQHEFQQVKSRRSRLFSECFEHVSNSIDQIYKQLCRNPCAQAILSAENPDEPYLDGISYNCVAPGKRFMAMDNLSGGEKSIAALALVFAIHSFRPAPFFVLDEVDAALDNTNINKLTSYIREQCRVYFQIIVISQKEEFYSKADALLGVYSEYDEYMFSRLLTLDLSPYPLNEETVTD